MKCQWLPGAFRFAAQIESDFACGAPAVARVSIPERKHRQAMITEALVCEEHLPDAQHLAIRSPGTVIVSPL